MVILSAGSSATTFNAAARSTHRRTGQLRWRYGPAVDSPARERTYGRKGYHYEVDGAPSLGDYYAQIFGVAQA
jgi:hypothetical protein